VNIPDFLGRKKRRMHDNPHKRSPDVYFRPIWYSKWPYRGFQYIAKVQKKSVRESANELALQTQKDFIVGVVLEAGERYRAELNALYRRGFDEKNAQLWFKLLHKVVTERAASGNQTAPAR